MSTIAKVSSIKELEEIKRNKFCKKRFLYPILFQEDFYGIAYNRFLNGVKYRKNQIYTFGNEYNFLTLKRLIGKSRQLNYSWIIYNQSLNKFRIIQEILIMIFNFIFAKESESIIKENEWNSSQSIHALFPFLESKIQNSTVCLDINIPYSIHPEILIRIVRQNIPDTSLLHFFRLLLYQNEHIDVSNPQFSLRKNQFYNLLWNIQIHKFEYSLIHICKQIYNFQSVLDWFFVDQTNFVQKIGYISEYSEFTPIKAFIRKNCLIQYGRYRNNLIISTNVNMNFSFKNWNLFFLIFWEKYFQVWIEIYRMNIKDLSKTPFCFLGYLFRIKNKYTLIKIQLVENSIYTNLIIKEFYNIIPIVPLIRLLAKEKFCDTSGRPICKVSWTTLTDHEIFRRFDQLIKNFFCYYSGCVKKKGLYQLQYILRFSCAKTLACKHKSTIRTVWKKYGSNFVANSVHLKKSRLNSWHTYEKKFWFLNIIKINHLAQLRDKFKNVRNS